MLLETVIPGGVAFFLGVGGIITGAMRLVGLFTDPYIAVLVWMLTSTALTIALRPIAMRYLGGDFSLAMTNEDAEAMGQVVTVVEPLTEDDSGRIRFRGATWDARTTEGRLPKGSEARILYRDNLTWIVEPVDHAAIDEELSDAIDADAKASDASNQDESPRPPNRDASRNAS